MNYGLVKFNSATDTERTRKALNVYEVNLCVYFEEDDEKNYTDLDDLYFETKRRKQISKTSQPSTGEISIKIEEALNNHEFVFVITPSKIMSGTHQNTMLAWEMLPEDLKKRVRIIENQSFGISEYITNDFALQLFEMDLDPIDIEQKLLTVINATCYYGCISSGENLKKGGRFDVSKFSQIQLKRMQVVIHQHNLKKGLVGMCKGPHATIDLLEKCIKKEKTKRCYFLSIKEKKGYKMELESFCQKNGIEFINCGEASPLVATQMGFGSFILGLQKEL